MATVESSVQEPVKPQVAVPVPEVEVAKVEANSTVQGVLVTAQRLEAATAIPSPVRQVEDQDL